MTQEIYHIEFKKSDTPVKPALATLCTGRQYSFVNTSVSTISEIHGLIGGYQLSTNEAKVLPLHYDKEKFSGFFWDTDVNLPDNIHLQNPDNSQSIKHPVLQSNHVQLTNCTLNGPELNETNGETELSVSPMFEMEFRSNFHTARLGAIRLVEANRFATLENGKKIILLDTHKHGEPVLLLPDNLDSQSIDMIIDHQPAKETQVKNYSYRINQNIPEKIEDHKVTSVTVLEQYSNYFMQQDVSNTNCIWTPACAPVLWGWSIRVERRTDDSWYIGRRKVMMPIISNNGMELPLWTANIFS